MPLPPVQHVPYEEGEPFTWKHCRGWLSDAEAAELARLSVGKKVLEVGTFCGKSTVAMAATAASVTCVDPFTGYAVDGMSQTEAEARENFNKAGVADKITIHVGTQEKVLPSLDLSDVEMVFYDADHSEVATGRGIRLLYESGLPETAVIAFHDYHPKDIGVVRAVDSWCVPKGLSPRVIDSLAVFDGTAETSRPHSYDVMLGVPTNGQSMLYGAAQALFRATWVHRVQINHYDKSLLACCFNKLWCDALNAAERGEITHMAFLHSDIAPADGWIDTLISEMEDQCAAFCSAVSPIKDARGLTSTGVGEPGLVWSPLRRFSMKEIMEFPETFDSDDTGNPGKVLLLNSGCWVADLRSPLFYRMDSDNQGKVYFEVNDRIVKTDQCWVHQVESEDWFFSRCLHANGIRAVATRKVPLVHMGMSGYGNDTAWGSQECDEDLRPLWGEVAVT